MHLLIASDSFKDALEASEVCRAIKSGWQAGMPHATCTLLPMADGGEGFVDILKGYLEEAREVSIMVDDALRRPRRATYLFVPSRKMAIIEIAQAVGLQRLSPEERNPMHTSSFGIGQMIAHALQRGATSILLGLGGSATHDGGMGMAQALGWRFLDQDGLACQALGGHLGKVCEVLPPSNLPSEYASFEVACDVRNPLFGPRGAAHVFAPQKGAGLEEVEILESGLQHFFYRCTTQEQAKDRDGCWDEVSPGFGAAGGLGFGAAFFLGATLRSGADLMLHYSQMEAHMKTCDLVITGEGSLDAQTMDGKLILSICQMASRCGKPVIALCGSHSLEASALEQLGLRAAFSISPGPCSLPEALRHTVQNLERTAFHLARLMTTTPV